MTTHRHLDSRKLWTSTVTDPDLSQLTARVTALEAAMAKLGGLVGPPPTLPPAPTGLKALAGNGYVTLTWNAG